MCPVAVTSTIIELVFYQTQEDSYEEKTPKPPNQTQTKSLERSQGLEILPLTEAFVWLNLSYPNLFL